MKSRAHHVFNDVHNSGYKERFVLLYLQCDSELTYCRHYIHERKVAAQNPEHIVCKLSQLDTFPFINCILDFSRKETNQDVILYLLLLASIYSDRIATWSWRLSVNKIVRCCSKPENHLSAYWTRVYSHCSTQHKRKGPRQHTEGVMKTVHAEWRLQKAAWENKIT